MISWVFSSPFVSQPTCGGIGNLNRFAAAWMRISVRVSAGVR